MEKNIKIRVKTETGYDTLYPMANMKNVNNVLDIAHGGHGGKTKSEALNNLGFGLTTLSISQGTSFTTNDENFVYIDAIKEVHGRINVKAQSNRKYQVGDYNLGKVSTQYRPNYRTALAVHSSKRAVAYIEPDGNIILSLKEEQPAGSYVYYISGFWFV